jgi:hypothetical protein
MILPLGFAVVVSALACADGGSPSGGGSPWLGARNTLEIFQLSISQALASVHHPRLASARRVASINISLSTTDRRGSTDRRRKAARGQRGQRRRRRRLPTSCSASNSQCIPAKATQAKREITQQLTDITLSFTTHECEGKMHQTESLKFSYLYVV